MQRLCYMEQIKKSLVKKPSKTIGNPLPLQKMPYINKKTSEKIMSGECEKCWEHCLDCKCLIPFRKW